MTHLLQADKEKRRIGLWLLTVTIILIGLITLSIVLYYRGIKLVVDLWPYMLGIALIINHNAYGFYLMRSMFSMERKINSKLADINGRVDSIINERNASIVKLPDDFPLGPRTQSGVTIDQILRHLVSTSSAEQQRSIARSYLGQFVTWECKIYSWESIGNGQLEFTLGIVNEIQPSIFVKALESEVAHIKTLPPHSSVITVEGRIYEICTLSRHVRIDYPNLAFNREASSHPSGAAPSP